MSHEATRRRVVGGLRKAAGAGILGAAVLSGALVTPVQALEEQKGEAAAIEACDKRLCSILTSKSTQGPDLKCALTKTWARSTIKEADNRQVTWGFGDARCTVDINISRASLVEAVTGDHVSFRPGRLTANCVVEQDGKLEKVTAVVSPKIEFRNGKADKIWIRLKSVEGPASVTLTLQTAANLADTFGIFHSRMIKSVNRYIDRHCPQAMDVAETQSKAKAKDK